MPFLHSVVKGLPDQQEKKDLTRRRQFAYVWAVSLWQVGQHTNESEEGNEWGRGWSAHTKRGFLCRQQLEEADLKAEGSKPTGMNVKCHLAGME